MIETSRFRSAETISLALVIISLNLWGPPYGLGLADPLWAAPAMSGRVS